LTQHSVGQVRGTYGRTEVELLFALLEDEKKLGREHTPGERLAFARGFFGPDYAEDIRRLAEIGHLAPEEDEEAC
jgi:hypothetical protein